MATPLDSSDKLCASVARLAGTAGRKCRHGYLFRIPVTSSDGEKHAVTLQVDTHRKRPSKAAMNDAADRLRVSRNDILEVLERWGADDLRRHLESLPISELRSRTPIP